VVIENIPQLAIEGSLYDERAIRNERYKLILRKFDSRPVFRPGELYDLQDDRGETNNLYASRTEIAKGLAAELSAWGTRYDDRLSIELGNYAAGKAH
jgi:arylsulfatase A-like enzyme